jgi:hypothetical protein
MATPTSSIQLATTRSVGDEIVRVVWLFQAACALPTFLVLGFLSFAELFSPYISIYDFTSVVMFS